MTCMMYLSQFWILFGALVCLNALDQCNRGCTDFITITASLESEVLLPCYLDSSNKTERVEWSHLSIRFLNITPDGNVLYENPKGGRVIVFPLVAEEGNFSILIHDLQSSDLGTYCCSVSRECRRVEITELPRPAQKSHEVTPWLYFAAGAGLFLLLFIAFSLFSKFNFNETCLNRSLKSNPVNEAQNEGNSPQETQHTERSEPRKKYRGRIRSPTVYENDVHAPNPISGIQQGQYPQRAFRAVPEPPTGHQKPYYVNHAELAIPDNAGKKKKRQKHYQFKNPIYGD